MERKIKSHPYIHFPKYKDFFKFSYHFSTSQTLYMTENKKNLWLKYKVENLHVYSFIQLLFVAMKRHKNLSDATHQKQCQKHNTQGIIISLCLTHTHTHTQMEIHSTVDGVFWEEN